MIGFTGGPVAEAGCGGSLRIFPEFGRSDKPVGVGDLRVGRRSDKLAGVPDLKVGIPDIDD
jgi:hypothetical protein